MNFRDFFTEANNNEQDVRKTLKKLPKSHRKLIDRFRYKFQPDNTLKGDKEHIGIIDPDTKTITIAAPWNYGREYALLHELGHLLWAGAEKELRDKWSAIVKKTKHKQKQGAEELFCMAYANTYANNKIVIHDHPDWEKFIKALPK